MFEERPYRQNKQSLWSIWWFVGLMACGLTAWHLELIPLTHQNPAGISSEKTPFPNQSGTSAIGIVESAIPFSANPEKQSGSFQNQSGRLGQAEPLPPQDISAQSEPDVEDFQVSETRSVKPSFLQQASYEQTAPVPDNSQKQAPQPFFDSKEEFTPVQTLTYRSGSKRVDPQTLPPAGATVPVRPASHQLLTAQRIPNPASSQQNNVSQIQTTARLTEPTDSHSVPAEPFHLTAEARKDILRHRQLSERYWKHPEKRAEIAGELERLARVIYFSPENDYFPAYEVQPGDQIRLIARDYDVSWEYLAKLNRTKPEQIRPGQKLKVIKGPFDAVVDLKDYRITVHAHGYYICSFPIGTGKNEATPTGKFRVLNKEQNPTYYGSEKVISRDDPLNPLGEHWIALGKGYGIHGTINPASIGQSVSKGCIRMHNADVAQIYDLLTTKSVVTIR